MNKIDKSNLQNAKTEQQIFIDHLNKEIGLKKYKSVFYLCCQGADYIDKNNNNNQLNDNNNQLNDNNNQFKNNKISLVFEALKFAYHHHSGQKRKSGELYITHPVAVAEIVAGTLGLKDPELIAATILHDIVEDVSRLTTFNIEKLFGKNVAAFVDGCTKLKMMSLDKTLNKDMTYQKLILMASDHPEILLIKFADRIHNLQTINSLKEHKRQRIAQETIEIYGPLAEKLGLFSVKRILFDLSIRQRFPSKSKKLLSILRGEETCAKINEVEQLLNKALENFQFNTKIISRLKNLYAFYSPAKGTLDINNAENLVDFTVIIDSGDVLNCYTAMGMITTNIGLIAKECSLVPKTIRDYIANPKISGYKSLHFRIVHKDRRYLIKIRTSEMERIARKGLLLHWDEPENTTEYRKVITDALKSIGEYQGSPVNRKNMIRQLSEDDKIFVYTPNGDIQYLPTGSIVLDFAYRVHSNLGDRCNYAKVNNAVVGRSHILNDGDVVKIVTSDEPIEINAYMEGRCKTPKARSAVNRQLQKKRDMFAREIGRDIMLQAIKPHGLTEELFKSDSMLFFLTYKRYENIDQLFISVGQSIDMPREILWEVAEIPPKIKKTTPLDDKEEQNTGQQDKEEQDKEQNSRFIMTISEIERDIHKFSQCCNPLPGMNSCLALLSRDGISLHREYCDKYKDNREYELNRIQIMDVIWDIKYKWEQPLTFLFKTSVSNIMNTIKMIADINLPIEIHLIEESHSAEGLNIAATFNSFAQIKAFFSCFEKEEHQIEIQDYGRYEFLMGID